MATTRYSNGQYSVEVWENGVIVVKPGDWLSKYSAAMFNNFDHIDEFYRRHPQSGDLVEIRNKNLIEVGEWIFHKPTYEKWKRTPNPKEPKEPGGGNGKKPGLTKKQFLKELSEHGRLRGEHLQGISKAIDYAGYIENEIAFMELLAESLALGEEIGFVTAAGSAGAALTFLGAIGTVVGGVIAVINAWEAGLRATGIRAISYAITAWGFDDPMPTWLPYKLELALRSNFPRPGADADELVRRNLIAWNDSLQATSKKLSELVRKNQTDKLAFQLYIRGVDINNDKKEVCKYYWRSFADKFPSNAGREAYLSIVPDYPI